MNPTACPKCGGCPLAHETDQYGPRTYCRHCGWDDAGLAGKPPIYMKAGNKRGIHEGPYLPTRG